MHLQNIIRLIKIRAYLAISCLILLSFAASSEASSHQLNTNILLRYENDNGDEHLEDRERVRLIAKVGLTSNWSDAWQSTFRVSTGLKNKQNVPAVTLFNFTDHATPDRDVYIDQFFLSYSNTSVNLLFGKLPWKSKQVTDTFWDRDLHPYGVSVDMRLSSDSAFFAGYYFPLDGVSNTVGQLSIMQYQRKWRFDNAEIEISPWWADFNSGEARFATRDTNIDNTFVYISSSISYKKWSVGADIGKSIVSQRQFEDSLFVNQKLSYVFEIRYGSLQNINSTLLQLRLFSTEKYATVTEVAQNAVSRFSTNNHKGWDVRMRRMVTDDMWLGVRYSESKTLVGPDKSGRRLRIELNMQL